MSIDRWMDIKDVVYVYIHTMIYYSSIKKNEILAINNNMYGLEGYYAKWNKPDKDKYHIISLTWGILKNTTN